MITPYRRIHRLSVCSAAVALLLAATGAAHARPTHGDDPTKPFVRDSHRTFFLGQLGGKAILSLGFEHFITRGIAPGAALGPGGVPLYVTLIPAGNRFAPYFAPGILVDLGNLLSPRRVIPEFEFGLSTMPGPDSCSAAALRSFCCPSTTRPSRSQP